ncbi:MAG: regulator [Rhodocyclaceae bacterium]|nr:regulator [Rhodocyclaceae bacterium]
MRILPILLAPFLMAAGVAAGQVGAKHPPLPQPVREGKVITDPNAKFTHFRVGNKNVKSIYVDGRQVWVGTSGGVVRYDTRDDSFKLFDTKSGLLSNGVFYVGRLKGRLAVGTYGGGLSLLTDEQAGTWKTYNIPEGLGDAFVYDVLEAKNGDIWIATWSGVNRVRGGALDDRSKWDLYTVENTRGGVPNDWVYGLAEGRNGDIWLATEGGMARYAKGRWENWNHARGLGAPYEKVKDAIAFKNDPGKASVHHAKQKEEMGLSGVDVAYNPNYVVSIEVDKDGQVWAGTWGGGLSRFDGKRWISYTTADGLPGNHVFMLHRDEKGRLWVGTNNGLTTWENGRFAKTLTTADGLFANNIFAMASAPDGDLWIGSFGGVAHLRPAK